MSWEGVEAIDGTDSGEVPVEPEDMEVGGGFGRESEGYVGGGGGNKKKEAVSNFGGVGTGGRGAGGDRHMHEVQARAVGGQRQGGAGGCGQAEAGQELLGQGILCQLHHCHHLGRATVCSTPLALLLAETLGLPFPPLGSPGLLAHSAARGERNGAAAAAEVAIARRRVLSPLVRLIPLLPRSPSHVLISDAKGSVAQHPAESKARSLRLVACSSAPPLEPPTIDATRGLRCPASWIDAAFFSLSVLLSERPPPRGEACSRCPASSEMQPAEQRRAAYAAPRTLSRLLSEREESQHHCSSLPWGLRCMRVLAESDIRAVQDSRSTVSTDG